MLIDRMATTITTKSKEIIELYEDADGDFKKEQNVFAGHLRASAVMDDIQEDFQEADVWDNFYTKLNQIDTYHQKYNTSNDLASNENLESDMLFAQQMDMVLEDADKVFSGEECHGKYMDLHRHYLMFCNIKKLRLLNLIKSDDYLSWLQNFDKFNVVPLYLKQSSKYEGYISELKEYMCDIFKLI